MLAAWGQGERCEGPHHHPSCPAPLLGFGLFYGSATLSCCAVWFNNHILQHVTRYSRLCV